MVVPAPPVGAAAAGEEAIGVTLGAAAAGDEATGATLGAAAAGEEAATGATLGATPAAEEPAGAPLGAAAAGEEAAGAPLGAAPEPPPAPAVAREGAAPAAELAPDAGGELAPAAGATVGLAQPEAGCTSDGLAAPPARSYSTESPECLLVDYLDWWIRWWEYEPGSGKIKSPVTVAQLLPAAPMLALNMSGKLVARFLGRLRLPLAALTWIGAHI